MYSTSREQKFYYYEYVVRTWTSTTFFGALKAFVILSIQDLPIHNAHSTKGSTMADVAPEVRSLPTCTTLTINKTANDGGRELHLRGSPESCFRDSGKLR